MKKNCREPDKQHGRETENRTRRKLKSCFLAELLKFVFYLLNTQIGHFAEIHSFSTDMYSEQKVKIPWITSYSYPH